MHRALGELPSRQQEAVRLKLQDGLSYRAIAEVMDTSIGNVGHLIHHGMASLRACLSEDTSTRVGRDPAAVTGGQHD